MATAPYDLNPDWENSDQSDYWFFLDPETGEDETIFSIAEEWDEEDDENFDIEAAHQDMLDDL